MRVLSLGTDVSILDPLSESAKRQIAYGVHFDRMDIIVFTRIMRPDVSLSTDVHAHSTRSRNRLFYGWDALWLSRKVPKPDVVTAQDPFETGLIAWLIARLRGAKLHVQVHTDFFAPSFMHSTLNRIRLFVARFVLARADRIRVVSERIKDGIVRTYAPRAAISVLPIFVDVTKFRSAHAGVLAGRFASFSTRVLVVARLEKEKNVALAIESFATAAPKDACLIIVGDGSERRSLEKVATRHDLARRIFFEGSRAALPYYAVVDLVLVPSHYEGYGLVIIEALAAGKPVIAADVGVAREAGAIIAAPVDFAERLREWCANGPRRMELRGYPYSSFEDYVERYTSDLKATL